MGTAHGTGVPSCKREGFLLLNGVALDRARAGADAGAGAGAGSGFPLIDRVWELCIVSLRG